MMLFRKDRGVVWYVCLVYRQPTSCLFPLLNHHQFAIVRYITSHPMILTDGPTLSYIRKDKEDLEVKF